LPDLLRLIRFVDALVAPLRRSDPAAKGQTAHNPERRCGVHHGAAEVETAAFPEWQAAGEAVIMAAEDRGPLCMHISMMLALHGAKPIPEYDASKVKHWERHKLKRDEEASVGVSPDVARRVAR
jgi:hypothetical protein